MNYQTFEPGHELSAFVKCYWTLESPPEEHPEKQTIVPDGCMEMIFHYGQLYRQFTENGNSFIQPRCFVIGQLTRPLEIAPTGETGIFSVRFHPNGFFPFATLSIKEMENTAVPLEQLFGPAGTELENEILTAGTVAERITRVEIFLLNRLNNQETIQRVVRETVEAIITGNGQLSVHELSEQTRVNRRQLERKCASVTGLSPKQLSKMIRLQVALKLLLNRQYTSLTALAYEGEYYDQAHFIKDFKELTGCTPKEFYGNNRKMTSLFINTD
ncbi:MAG: helix-turn-helix transcriptional regulator [Dinghuibacter sp.]|nr:helix-turn-helix transcriptional regulator [Dinghuibacter sp.]